MLRMEKYYAFHFAVVAGILEAFDQVSVSLDRLGSTPHLIRC